jgi:hypothetical protein
MDINTFLLIQGLTGNTQQRDEAVKSVASGYVARALPNASAGLQAAAERVVGLRLTGAGPEEVAKAQQQMQPFIAQWLADAFIRSFK